jgi:hypothetical protein
MKRNTKGSAQINSNYLFHALPTFAPRWSESPSIPSLEA